MMWTTLRVFLVMLLLIALMVAGSAFGGVILWVAWNYGVAAVAHVPHLAYWPAAAICLGLSLVASYFRSSGSKAS